ncbi:MAG: hypothetical protein MIO93_01935 [ANME-2 cluster archaeon]|jgi:hypothetical protein|nr:hypothetical protein [ANME-2 cluster archaeon]
MGKFIYDNRILNNNKQYILKHLAGDAKMDVFWTIYNTLDEIGRRELIKRLMVRPLKTHNID